jgi:hypothetical protein
MKFSAANISDRGGDPAILTHQHRGHPTGDPGAVQVEICFGELDVGGHPAALPEGVLVAGDPLGVDHRNDPFPFIPTHEGLAENLDL